MFPEDDGQYRYAGARRVINKKKQAMREAQAQRELQQQQQQQQQLAISPTASSPPSSPPPMIDRTLKPGEVAAIMQQQALQAASANVTPSSPPAPSYPAKAVVSTQQQQPPPINKPTAAPSKPDKPEKQSIIIDEVETGSMLGDYQLMESIGRGGFGVVYRGLDIRTGRTVAIKRVMLSGIPADELEGIEAEIDLLRYLNHPNIVLYFDSIRTAQHLNIVLEFAENGSLSSLLSKMGGKLPEPLVSHYTAQVLAGLTYLHSQGVIHRDIKGANILATKDGSIKLADFGVATKLNDTVKSDSVVGTPYVSTALQQV